MTDAPPSGPQVTVRRATAADADAVVAMLVEVAGEGRWIATEVFTLAESLGGVESLIELPGEMTHASVAGTDAEVPADLVRLSVGVEHPDDLVADLAQALDRA